MKTGHLPDAAARRLSNQLARAYRGTYGASTGLCTIMKSVTRQMLRDGSTPAAVSRVFEEYVLTHPAGLAADPQNTAGDPQHSRMLVELAQQCVADVVLETPVIRGQGDRRAAS